MHKITKCHMKLIFVTFFFFNKKSCSVKPRQDFQFDFMYFYINCICMHACIFEKGKSTGECAKVYVCVSTKYFLSVVVLLLGLYVVSLGLGTSRYGLFASLGSISCISPQFNTQQLPSVL